MANSDKVKGLASYGATSSGGLAIAGRAPAFSNLPDLATPVIGSAACLLVGLVALFLLGGGFYASELELAIAFGIVIVGMVVQVGFSHQFAFSQSVFMGFGAYSVAVLNTRYNWPIAAATIATIAATVLISLLLGALLTKVPGFALALTTLFFVTIVVGLVTYSSFLGGQTGIGGIEPLWSSASYSGTLLRSGAIGVILLVLCVFLGSRVMKSGIGLELALLGVSEEMAASVGVRTRRRKLEVFVFGSAIAALGGAVYAGTQAFVSSASFNGTAELTLFMMLFLGGRASIFGALIGTVVIQFLSGASNFIDINLPIIEGVLFTIVLLFAPNGLIELLQRLVSASYARYNRDRGGGTDGAAVEAAGFAEGEVPAPREPLTGSLTLVSRDAVPDRTAGGEPGGASGAAEVGQAELECRNVVKRFGGVLAVAGVNATFEGKGIHAICGPNGAGKSTLFDIIAGSKVANEGEIFIRGINVTKRDAFDRAQLGVARTFQNVRLMNRRMVIDNVAVAAVPSHETYLPRAFWRSGLAEARERAASALEAVGILEMAYRYPPQLTLEAQRMVELARAVVSRPEILLLDEPASGLSLEQRGRLGELLVSLGRAAVVVLVEHDLQLVARISKDIHVLVDGRVVFSGDPEGFSQSAVVRSQLMGLGGIEKVEEASALTPVDGSVREGDAP